MNTDSIKEGKHLEIRPISLANANAFIIKNHRHHDKVVGHKFSISCYEGEKLVGVACVGRPMSRHLDDDKTLEVTRLCTDGTYNACSKLYSRCARITKELGYKKIITYILDKETGVSLKATGWHCEDANCGGEVGHLRADRGNWSRSISSEKSRNIRSAKSKGG